MVIRNDLVSAAAALGVGAQLTGSPAGNNPVGRNRPSRPASDGLGNMTRARLS